MALIGWMEGRHSGQGSGANLEMEIGRKCSFGEILRPVWDLVGIRAPGDIQEEVSGSL